MPTRQEGVERLKADSHLQGDVYRNHDCGWQSVRDRLHGNYMVPGFSSETTADRMELQVCCLLRSVETVRP